MTESNEIKKYQSLERSAESAKSPEVEAPNLVETSEVHEQIETALPSESAERAAEDGAIKGGKSDDFTETKRAAGGVATGQLKSLPTQKAMTRQVEKSIEKEIRDLKREARRMQWFFWKFDPNRYQMIIRQIRHLCNVLASLAHATYENVKSLWLKYVQKHT